MGVIRVLSDTIANKIAAGEVVERPASVVKELVENALDAGARHIRVELEAGGRKRIRIIDDGCGMVQDDALLAFERHATSKLREIEDLDAISTLGFRGEALPSIASVSRLLLETAPKEAREGTRIEIAGGKMRDVQPAGLPHGTSITVDDLFFNVPARRKFLKAEATELGHVATLLTHYALAYPEIHFELDTAHRTILNAPPARDAGERLQQLLGNDLLGQMVEVQEAVQWPAYPSQEQPAPGEETVDASMSLHGFVSRPELQKLNRNSIFTFVNRRLVRDRIVQHALLEAYRNMLPNGAYPVALLFIDLPYSEVDVNVHPAKTEVRFRRQGFVHDAVRDVVRRALGVARPVPSFVHEQRARPTAGNAWSGLGRELAQQIDSIQPQDPLGVSLSDLNLQQAREEYAAQQAGAGYDQVSSASDFRLTPELLQPQAQPLPFMGPASGAPSAQHPPPAPAYVPESRHGCAGEVEELIEEDPGLGRNLARLKALGQIRDSFIIASHPDGLWLVDQHAAHERVLFEQILQQRLRGEVERQQLLLPLIVELDPGRWVRFAEIEEELRAAGFDAEPFGTRTIAIKATPAGIASVQVQRLLDELLDLGDQENRTTSLDAVRTRIAATIACHAAIKVNMRLDIERMDWILHQLAEARYPMTCPHGRPVLLRYGLQDIQRAFKRIK